jgi:hypothetical protein
MGHKVVISYSQLSRFSHQLASLSTYVEELRGYMLSFSYRYCYRVFQEMLREAGRCWCCRYIAKANIFAEPWDC